VTGLPPIVNIAQTPPAIAQREIDLGHAARSGAESWPAQNGGIEIAGDRKTPGHVRLSALKALVRSSVGPGPARSKTAPQAPPRVHATRRAPDSVSEAHSVPEGLIRHKRWVAYFIAQVASRTVDLIMRQRSRVG
jgi:hypothetical protein